MHLLLIGALLALSSSVQAPPASPWPRGRPAVFVGLSYPEEALTARITGRVIVQVSTDDAGRVTAAEALAGPNVLVPPVLANVKQWTLSKGVGTDAIVYRFEIDPGLCGDDRHSLFRLVKPNLAVITACSDGALAERALHWPSDGPQVISRGVHPAYPSIAAAARITGAIVLELTADADGKIEPRPLTNDPFLAPVAVAHAKQWRVAPGQPGRFYEVYEFALDNHACDDRVGGTVFWWVTEGYWRLSGCAPMVQPD